MTPPEAEDEAAWLGCEAPLEGRNIVVLSDGTGNSSAKLFRTNVWKLYKALDLDDPVRPEHPRQFALYDDGVGSSSFGPLAIVGGVFGVGLARNVQDLYAFVCRTYRPGDRIYAFGFSRGAFTARIVAGLIVSQGLVPYEGDESKLNRDVAAAYRAYRTERTDKLRRLETAVRAVGNLVFRIRDHLFGYEPYEALRARLAGSPLLTPRIRFVGVWDTVAAYGLPIHELTRAFDRFIWRFSMPDNDLSWMVDRAMHALALDEERQTFLPELWNEGPSIHKPIQPAPNEGCDTSCVAYERLSQVWFAGVHSDIGGGYPDDALSYTPLLWMMKGACKAGLRFKPSIARDYQAASDDNGLMHDSRKGLAGYYRYTPRRIERLAPPSLLDRRGKRRRVSIARVKIHESALERIAVGQDGYAPISPPPTFDVATLDGRIVPAERFLSDRARAVPFGAGVFAREREHVFNPVWWRRVVYFLTLLVTCVLAAMPAYAPGALEGACREAWLCAATPFMSPVRVMAPGFTAPWFESFSSHPDLFTTLTVALGAGLWLGGAIDGAIHDRMRAIWARVPRTSSRSATPFAPPPAPGRAALALEQIRLSPRYKQMGHALRRVWLPNAAIIVAGALVVMLVVKAGHSLRSAGGRVCLASTLDDGARDLPGVGADAPLELDFTPSNPCQSTGRRLVEGATYRLTFAIPPESAWRDSTIPAGPYGLDESAQPAWLALFTPLRRHWAQPWFKPMARIGSFGNDDYPLEPDPSVGRSTDAGDATAFAARLVARSSGELFLYVNDAVGLSWFYGNNHGSARVVVQRVTPENPAGAARIQPSAR